VPSFSSLLERARAGGCVAATVTLDVRGSPPAPAPVGGAKLESIARRSIFPLDQSRRGQPSSECEISAGVIHLRPKLAQHMQLTHAYNAASRAGGMCDASTLCALRTLTTSALQRNAASNRSRIRRQALTPYAALR
jgi:hypothetical protein